MSLFIHTEKLFFKKCCKQLHFHLNIWLCLSPTPIPAIKGIIPKIYLVWLVKKCHYFFVLIYNYLILLKVNIWIYVDFYICQLNLAGIYFVVWGEVRIYLELSPNFYAIFPTLFVSQHHLFIDLWYLIYNMLIFSLLILEGASREYTAL